MKDIFLKLNFQNLEKLDEFHNDLTFLPQRMKIVKFEKHVANLHDKNEYAIHIQKLKQGSN